MTYKNSIARFNSIIMWCITSKSMRYLSWIFRSLFGVWVIYYVLLVQKTANCILRILHWEARKRASHTMGWRGGTEHRMRFEPAFLNSRVYDYPSSIFTLLWFKNKYTIHKIRSFTNTLVKFDEWLIYAGIVNTDWRWIDELLFSYANFVNECSLW